MQDYRFEVHIRAHAITEGATGCAELAALLMSDWLPVEDPSSPMTTSPCPIEGDRAVSTRTKRLLNESVSTRSGVRTRTNAVSTLAPFTVQNDSSPE